MADWRDKNVGTWSNDDRDAYMASDEYKRDTEDMQRQGAVISAQQTQDENENKKRRRSRLRSIGNPE